MITALAQVSAVFTNGALAAAGAAAISIPIIIHLLSRLRRRQEPWAAMRFLLLAFRKHKQRLQIEQLLLLLVRCLLLAVLGLALAGPVVSGLDRRLGLDAPGRLVMIVLDDSLSTHADTFEGTRFEQLRQTTRQLIEGLRPTDRLAVWRASAPMQQILAPAPVDVTAARQLLASLEPRYSRSDLVGTFQAVGQLADDPQVVRPGEQVTIFLISDFSAGAVDLERQPPAWPARAAGVFLSRPMPEAPNVQIARLAPRRRMVLLPPATGVSAVAASVPVELQLQRFAADQGDVVTRVLLTITSDGAGVTLGSATHEHRWSAGQSVAAVNVEVMLDAAIDDRSDAARTVVLSAILEAPRDPALRGGDALAADNQRYSTVELRRRLTAAVIDDPIPLGAADDQAPPIAPRDWLGLALAPSEDRSVELLAVNIQRLAAELLSAVDVAFVLRPDRLTDAGIVALGDLADRGGIVWLIAPAADVAPTWAPPLMQKLGLNWRAAIQARQVSENQAPWSAALDLPVPEPLGLLGADWDALLRPVRVDRALEVLPTDPSSDVWLMLNNGLPLLLAQRRGEGMILLLTTALDAQWSNLPIKPLFVPLLHETLRGVLGSGESMEALCGTQPSLGRRWRHAQHLERVSANASGVSEGRGATIALRHDEQGTSPARPLTEPGIYLGQPPEGGRKLAVNVEAAAGDTRNADGERLLSFFKAQWFDDADPAAVLVVPSQQANLGWPLLWTALALLLIEMLLARWFSHAHRVKDGADDAAPGRLRLGAIAAAPVLAFESGLDRLLGITGGDLSWADSRATLGWRYDLPAWAWVALAITALLIASFSYRHLLGPRRARTTLTIVRGLLILWIIMLLAGPMLVIAREKIEPDALVVLVDRSASMGIADMLDAEGEPLSRDDALREALREQGTIFGAEQLGHDRHVLWFGFDEGIYSVDPAALPPATGQATALRTAIEQALRRAAGHPISSVVLFSDGRSPQPIDADFTQRLTQQAVPVFTVPLGSEQASLDLAVVQVDAPDKAFVNDTIPVIVHLNVYPTDAPLDPGQVRVRLIDPQTGRVLDEKSPDDEDVSRPVRLSTESALIGPVTWRVEVSYDPPLGGPRELITENNSRLVMLELIDRPIRVLYVEGYPRWEFRYLKNMLLREGSIQCSTLLISADREFAQEGDLPITRLPATAEEFEPYDVIIIGDVPSGYFSPQQLELIRDQVSQRGSGLLWLGGASHTPRSYDATELTGLLPMRWPGAVEARSVPPEGLAIRPTAQAAALSVLQLRLAGAASGRSSGDDDASTWPAALLPLRWAQDLGELKPAAEVIAHIANMVDAPAPVMVRMNYGAGQSLYVGTDETWRWRYGRGEFYFEQVWTQLVRLLGRGRIQQDNQRVQMRVSSRRVNLDQAVVVTLRIDDPLLLRNRLERVPVQVRSADDPAAAVLERFDLRPVRIAGRSPTESSAAMQYEAVWRPATAGRLVLRVTAPALEEFEMAQLVEVLRPEDEMRQPTPDHARLAFLAQQTGGAVIPITDLEELVAKVPNRARRTPDDIRQPLWNSHLALIIPVVLLTIEWIGRKIIRLA